MAVIIPFPNCSGLRQVTSVGSREFGRGRVIAFDPTEVPGEFLDEGVIDTMLRRAIFSPRWANFSL
jgi:hypothetical protein